LYYGYSIMRIKSHRVCGFTDMVNFRVFFEVMAEPRRAWMKLTPDSDSATPKTYSTHSETPQVRNFFFLLCGCVIEEWVICISIVDPNLYDLRRESSSPLRPRRRIACPRDSRFIYPIQITDSSFYTYLSLGFCNTFNSRIFPFSHLLVFCFNY